MLPPSGSVLGIDVGTSLVARSSGICRLTWTESTVTWHNERCTFDPTERQSTLRRVLGEHRPLSVAIDGPLGRGFQHIGKYRAAERMLTRRLAKHIGKPGQSNSPNGIELNAGANAYAADVLALDVVGSATHAEAIDAAAIVEAFPTSFLGVLIGDPSAVPATKRQKSDRFFAYLAANGRLGALLAAMLPGRTPAQSFSIVKNHDDRSALICALTALILAAGDYSAVGDADGWIVLPPLRFMAPWTVPMIRANQEPSFSGRFVSWNQDRQLVLSR